MKLEKRHLFAVLALCLFLCATVAYRVFAQGPAARSALTFTASDRGYVFFDHANSKIYIYNSANGELQNILQLQRLGDDLVRLQ